MPATFSPYMHLLKASSIYSLNGFDMTRCNQNFKHVHHSCGVMKYHFSGTKIIKPPKARAKASKEALEMWTEVSRASGDIYAEPSARKSGHQSANNSTIMATGISVSSINNPPSHADELFWKLRS
ncbi:hypothetical protein Bca4012_026037 [Brassica carinata]